MEPELSDEQRELRDAARRYLERECGTAYVREMMDDARGWSEKVWRETAALGWTALGFPEEYGGLGPGFDALAILCAEMGRVVFPGPFASTVVLAGGALLEAGTEEQRAQLLPAICSGDLVATLAFSESGRRFDPSEVALRASVDGDGWRLDGEKTQVTDGATAERSVVIGRGPGGVGLFLTDEGARPAATVLDSMDATRKVAHVRYEATPCRRLGDAGWPAVQRVLDRAAVAIAAEMVGGAERVLELTVEHAKTRVQFNRPIGSFQAVKHRAADMLLDLEGARHAVAYAAWAIGRANPEASLAASVAKAAASDASRRITSSGIQIHGGIGFTWEHDMHLYFRRAKASEAAFGDASWHRERIAHLLKARYVPR
jgi:alkylation response protein AidB-like acyl-CoA dehydrogenase